MSLSDPFAPPDPAYAPFVKGLEQVASDAGANANYFWHPKTSKWYFYPHKDWILEDPGLGSTTDSSAFGPPELKNRDGKWVSVARVNSLGVAALFAKVREAQAKAEATDPKRNLVWHPVGGYWRNAIKRTGAGGPGPNLPSEALKRLDEVDEQVRAGIIDHPTGELRKLQILAEYDRPRR
jgi:hypothetical protein